MTESRYKFRPKPKAHSLASAETETTPKEAICQLSAPKPKPKANFGRPLLNMGSKWALQEFHVGLGVGTLSISVPNHQLV